MSTSDGMARLTMVSTTARIWRRTAKEAEAARDALDDAIARAVDAGNSQRSVAQACDMSEPFIRKVLSQHKQRQESLNLDGEG